MKNIGIYGGSFDPIHIGHLITARAVKELRSLSEIIFVPASISPLKQENESVAAIHRLKMTELAIDNHSDFSLSDFEIQNSGISYTIKTLQHFKKKHKNIELIIGYDNYLVFDKWYQWEEILNLVDVVVLKRFNEESTVIPELNSDKFIFVETPTIQISSTAIRERIADNLPIDLLVPPKVQHYIQLNNLYK